MASQADVAAQMVATLAITEPDLDTSIGSVTRKIIDAVAQSVADSYIDQHLLTYQYDIDSKIGADLDDFVQLFGISRLAAKRATGVVTFYRGTGEANRNLFIPVGTQVAAITTPIQYAQTVTGGFMPVGVVSVDVPVQAVEPGTIGNIGTGLLTVIRTPLEGIPSCTNISPLTGGTAAEGDSELRARWKRIVFRSLAGTEPMYAGIALDEPACTQVSVVGASKTYREQVQIEGGVAVSSIDDAAYVYGTTSVLGPNIDAGGIFTRTHDYSFVPTHRTSDGSLRPKVVIKPGKTTYPDIDEDGNAVSVAVESTVLDLTFEYAPEATRNLPGQGITNRVDVWCAGVDAREATQTVVFQTTARFQNFTASPYYKERFVRQDQTNPEVNNVFIPLAFGPIITVPSTLSIGGQVYVLNTDYFIVHEDTSFGYASDSLFGLEFDQSNLPPGVNPVFDVGANGDYTYNAVPRSVQDGIDRWRLTGIDAKAHQAKEIALRFALAVIYQRGANQAVVNTQIQQALQTYLARLSFNATVQSSDVIAAVHAASGVDSVRFLDLGDYNPGSAVNDVAVGIQRIVNGTVVIESYVDPTTGQARDVTFGDNELPVFAAIVGDLLDTNGNPLVGRVAVRAQNTFYLGAG